MWQAVRNFVRTHQKKCQIINIGAGSDTLFWNLSEEGLQPQSFVELDFVQIVMKKIRIITKRTELFAVVSRESIDTTRDATRDQPTCNVTKTTINSPHYHLLSVDLRDEQHLAGVVDACTLETSLPTLVLAECVLCYMSPQASVNIMHWTSRTFPNSVFLNYEPCNMGDRFGSIMVENMRSRDCELPGIMACPKLLDQESRFIGAGFARAKALDMNEVTKLLPAEDVVRMTKIDFFDELEILAQLLEHYCLSWGSQGGVTEICFSNSV